MNLHLRLRRLWAGVLVFAFLGNILVAPPVHAQELILPQPGVRVALSPAFNPPVLKGIKVHPDNPFRFEFILDQGDGLGTDANSAVRPILGQELGSVPKNEALKEEANKLIKYFLASLTVPEKDLWVNLSPYEKDRIVPQSFGLTEMGRDLLAQDYLLKQITASLIYPEDEFGKKFWKRVYEEAGKKFGTTNIPVNTFNKVWIVPEKAVVYENAQAGTAYVVESRLKVMLEEDYLALSHSVISAKAGIQDTNALGSQIVREIVIPQLTQEINENKNFAQLRQVYNSLILATWYKKKIKDSILSRVYADKNKVSGLSPTRGHVPEGGVSPSRLPSGQTMEGESTPGQPPTAVPGTNDVETIYQQYLQAFKKGVYNYIKEEQDPLTQQVIPRKYFSGGATFFGLGDLAMSVKQMDRSKFLPLSKGFVVSTQIYGVGQDQLKVRMPFLFNGTRLMKEKRADRAMAAKSIDGDYLKQQVGEIFKRLRRQMRINSPKIKTSKAYAAYMEIMRSTQRELFSTEEEWHLAGCDLQLLQIVKAIDDEMLELSFRTSHWNSKEMTGLFRAFNVQIRLIKKFAKQSPEVNVSNLKAEASRAGANSPVRYIYHGLRGLLYKFFESQGDPDMQNNIKILMDDFMTNVVPLRNDTAAFQRFLAERKVEGRPSPFQEKLRKYIAKNAGLEEWQIVYVSKKDPLMIYLLNHDFESFLNKAGFQTRLLMEKERPLVVIDRDRSDLATLKTMAHEVAHTLQFIERYGQEFNRVLIEGAQIFEEMEQIEKLRNQDADREFQQYVEELLLQMVHNDHADTTLDSIIPGLTERQRGLLSYLYHQTGYRPETSLVVALAAFIDKRTGPGQGLRMIKQYVHDGNEEYLRQTLGQNRYSSMQSFINRSNKSSKEETSFICGLVEGIYLRDTDTADMSDREMEYLRGIAQGIYMMIKDDKLKLHLLMESEKLSQEFQAGCIKIINDIFTDASINDDSVRVIHAAGLFFRSLETLSKKLSPGKEPDAMARAIWRHYQTDGLLRKSSTSKRDEAQLVRKGGIDFNADKVDSAFEVRNGGGEIKFHIDAAMLEQLQNAPGFMPVIINIQPLQDLGAFLGV